jgi:hypothetical protein
MVTTAENDEIAVQAARRVQSVFDPNLAVVEYVHTECQKDYKSFAPSLRRKV